MGNRHATTLNGKHDSRCGLCGLSVYCLWVSDESPPSGCSDGLDQTPWRCSHVLSSLTMAVARIDHMGGELLPHHKQIIALVGKERADEIMAHVREHRRPPKAGKMQGPDYSTIRPL